MVSSGEFAAARMRRLWEPLYEAGADVIVTGHEHFYERFAPQAPDGSADAAYGIRQFIAGTGGAVFHRAGTRARHSEALVQEVLGVIRLTLRPSGYDWEFVDTQDGVRDFGTGTCHGVPPRR
jgi:hypothetical protein